MAEELIPTRISSTRTVPVRDGSDVIHALIKRIDAETGRAIAAEANLQEQLDKINILYIELLEGDGTFDDKTFAKLIDNKLNQLVYNNCHFTIAYRDDTVYRYSTDILEEGYNQLIDVNLEHKTWHYWIIGNPILTEHINDRVHHVNQADRDFWNNKVTCAYVNGEEEYDKELLVFSKN